ncbi:MAG: sugar phosphate isomerase/epimerase family protein [Desulfuromonadales bacterium]|nr:sugar phosphate isomerase/epimerase family protein [Desulfuromonadales bacterium]
MKNDLFVHVPWKQLGPNWSFFVDNRLQPEIAFKADDFTETTFEQVRTLSAELSQHGLRNTIHAPFLDLNPGALDPLVLKATRKRFHQTLDFAEILASDLIVFHPGYDRWRYGGQSHLWLETNLGFWPEFIHRAERMGCTLVTENIFEESPDTLAALLQAMDSPFFGACFDLGHWHLFGQSDLDAWLRPLAKHLRHLHLHDNHGTADEHLALGEGLIDFQALFRALDAASLRPSVTLEVHESAGIISSIATLKRLSSSGQRL